MTRPTTSLLLAALLLLVAGCASPGDRYQVASISFVAAVDSATELRKAGKLDPHEVDVVDQAVEEGHRALALWAEALRRGEDYPSGEEVIPRVVAVIRRHLRKEE